MMKSDKECELAKAQLSKIKELYDGQLKDLKSKGLMEAQAKESLSSSWTYAMPGRNRAVRAAKERQVATNGSLLQQREVFCGSKNRKRHDSA